MKFLLWTVLLVIGLLAACGGGGSGGGNGNGGTGTSTIQGAIQGAQGGPVASATVSVVGGGLSAAADQAGFFQIAGVPVEDRTVFKATSSGYLDSWKVMTVVKDQTTYITIALLEAGATATIDSALGGTVTDASTGASLTIDPGTLTVSGEVEVAIASLSPTGDAFPGFEAASTANAGEVSALESFGAVACAIRQNGAAVAADFTGTATIPLPSDRASSAPDTIDFWALNETTGLWERVGTGTKTTCSGAPCYRGAITHCSDWNAGREFEETFVHGTVRDASGNPVAGVCVFCAGSTYFGSDMAVTDSNGKFDCFVKYEAGGGVQFIVYARGAAGDGAAVGPFDAPTTQLAPASAQDIGDVLYAGTTTVDPAQERVSTDIWADWAQGCAAYGEDGKCALYLDVDLYVSCPAYLIHKDTPGSLVDYPYLLLTYDGDAGGPYGAFVRGYYNLPDGTYTVQLRASNGSFEAGQYLYVDTQIWNHNTQTGAQGETSVDVPAAGSYTTWDALEVHAWGDGVYDVETINAFGNTPPSE